MSFDVAGKTILVTGANGFLGRALISKLEAVGAKALTLSRSQGEVRADVSELEALRAALKDVSFDGVIHLASAGVRPDDAQNVFQANVIGTQNLLSVLETFLSCPVVVAGSWTEYGPAVGDKMKEGQRCEPASPYGISKLGATLLVQAWGKKHRRSATVLRFFQLFGPGDAPHRLIPTAIRAAKGETPSQFSARADFLRDFVHVDDAAEACIRALGVQEPGLVLNVGTGVGTTLGAVVEAIFRAAGSTSTPTWTGSEPRPWDVPSAIADTVALEEVLGWKPSRSILNEVPNLI